MTPETSAIDALGPYRLIRPLGKGGMGAVYLAQDTQLHRQVAIKQLLADENEGGYATLKKRFLREAQSAANLNHPNIVTIYHIGEQAGQPFIVMEFVEGGSWAELLRRGGGVAWPLALAGIRDAAAGLAAAHGAGIIHRDIKPANLMRRPGGGAADGECLTKIVDFGLARAAVADGDLTHPGAFIGSPSFVSPEQAACARVGPRSDVYSLGCTLFAMLTGRAPFVSDDPAEILEQHRDAPLPGLAGLVKEPVPQAVEALLRRMTAKKAGDRYESASAVMAAVDRLPLEAFLETKPGPVEKKAAEPEAAEGSRSEAVQSPPVAESADAASTLEALRRRLEDSRASGNLAMERDTHLSLFHLHRKLHNIQEAARAGRWALALHIKLAQTGLN